jgi:hypothetical protein
VSSRVRIYDSVLADLGAEVAEEAVLDGMLDGVDAARRFVPYDTGELHDDIDIVDEPHRVEGGVVGTYGSVNVDHALPVELGTERAPAQPYLRPSMDSVGRSS